MKCRDCLNVRTFKVGAGPELQSLKDAAALVEDEKESGRLLELLAQIEEKKPKASLYHFYLNHAEYLTNINYGLFDGCVHLFAPDALAANEAYQRMMNPPITDKINNSKSKWAMAAQLEGTLAFYGIFYCKKCGALENRLFIRVRYMDGKRENVFLLQNRCAKCGENLALADDDNCGFVHEGMETIGKCEVCGGNYAVESVTFGK